MTSLQDALTQSLIHARRLKEKLVSRARGRDEPLNLAPTVLAYRGEEIVSLTTCYADRDRVMQVCPFIASGFGADIVLVAFEGWRSNFEVNPATGREWHGGDMEDLVENHDGLAKGWITDTITVSAVNRAGDVGLGIQPMEIVRNRLVDWGEPILTVDDRAKPDTGVLGAVPAALLACMRVPTLPQIVPPELAEGMTSEWLLARTDVTAVRTICGRFPEVEMAVTAGAPGTDRRAIIVRELPGQMM